MSSSTIKDLEPISREDQIIQLDSNQSTMNQESSHNEQEQAIQQGQHDSLLDAESDEAIKNGGLGSGIPLGMSTMREEQEHCLNGAWVLWYMNGDTKSHAYQSMLQADTWASALVPLCTFSTIEGFWQLFNHISPPSKLRVKNDYMLFREGIKPQWEDVANSRGGSWKLLLPSKYRVEHLDKIWIEVLLSLIGESYNEDGEFITGAYLQRRQKEDRISIWTSNTDEKVKSIGTTFKETACKSIQTNINFSSHEEQYSDAGNQKQKHSSWKHRNNHVKYTV